MEAKRTLIHAHRGFSSKYPENTVPSIKAAMDLGADLIEIDIRKTKDGVIVLSHDDNIDRVSTGKGVISEHTLAELRQYDQSNPAVFGDKYKGTKIATFEEVLTLLRDNKNWHGKLNIELKTYDEVTGEAIDMIRSFGVSDRVMFCSFHLLALQDAKRIAPEIPCGYLVGEWIDLNIITDNHLEYIHPYCANEKNMEDARRRNIGANVWTVDAPENITAMLKLGVDGIISNVPDLAMKIRDEFYK